MGNEGVSYDNMAYIRRQTNKFGGPMGKVVEPEIINAMRGVYGLGTYVNKGVTHVNDFITGEGGNTTLSSSSVAPVSSSSSSVISSSSSSVPQSSSSVDPVSCSAQEFPWSSSMETTALEQVNGLRGAGVIYRDGDAVYASAGIKLFDVQGNMVRSVADSHEPGGITTMKLEGLRQGVYIARSNHNAIRINIR